MRRIIPSTMALQCFESAARHESFSKAARELSLSQGAVSRQIRILEEFLENKLFDRKRQRVELTNVGQIYLGEITYILQSLEISTLKIKSVAKLSGSLNVGCYPTLAARWLLPHILNYSSIRPELKLNSVTYQDNSEFDKKIIDIGIVQGNTPFSGFNADWLMEEKMLAVVSPSLLKKPLKSARSLLEYRLVYHVTRPLSWKIWFQTLGIEDVSFPTGLAFPQYDMVIEAALAGFGISLLPSVLIQKELEKNKLILAHSHVSSTESAYYLLTPKEKLNIPKINLFREWLLEQAVVD